MGKKKPNQHTFNLIAVDVCLVPCSGACNRGHQANILPYIYRKYKVNQGDSQVLFFHYSQLWGDIFSRNGKSRKVSQETVQMHLRTQTSVQRPPDICKPI